MSSAADDDTSFLLIDIDNAHLTKNVQLLGLGKMDPFVVLTSKPASLVESVGTIQTETHWNSHKEPVWFYECPPIAIPSIGNSKSLSNVSVSLDMSFLIFTVYNDSSLGAAGRSAIARVQISLTDLIKRTHAGKNHSLLGDKTKVVLTLQDESNKSAGTLHLQVKIKERQQAETSRMAVTRVDPSWFESPVKRLGVSGGTAPFFALTLTDAGLQGVNNSNPLQISDKSYFIGKDLSRAEDEKDFYEKILKIQAEGQEQRGVGKLIPFMFDYIGVLEVDSNEKDPATGNLRRYKLLVMQNLRSNYQTFRMLDLKMGQQTAQGGWQGKSRFAAMKQSLLDGITNSVAEGYRLEGFDGCPPCVESMDPLIDLTDREEPGGPAVTSESAKLQTYEACEQTIFGRKISPAYRKKARRIMMQTWTGADIMRQLMNVHQQPFDGSAKDRLLPVECAEIVLHQLVLQLVPLAITCHQVKVPQKWIGSSVALGFDAGLFPPRSEAAESTVRSKVLCNVFDWGRSELLTELRHEALSAAEQADRERFWNYYRTGMNHLAYDATRAYYHHFTNATSGWSELELQIMDFDSLTSDDYMGTATVRLPTDPSSTAVEEVSKEPRPYKLVGAGAGASSQIFVSIEWVELPESSRLRGTWRVTIDRATDLLPMDNDSTSDPYCIAIAKDEKHNGKPLRTLIQMTRVQARTLNPTWNETLSIPIMRQEGTLKEFLQEAKVVDSVSNSMTNADMAKLFQFKDPHQVNGGGAKVVQEMAMSLWSERLKTAAAVG